MNQQETDQQPPTQGTQSGLAASVIKEVQGLRHILGLVFKLGILGAVLLVIAIGGVFFSWRASQSANKAAHEADTAASTNTELLNLARPLLQPETLAANRHRQACLVLLAADKPVAPSCAEIREELIRIQAGGR